MTSTTTPSVSSAASWPRNVRHIALVGHPKCGKSTFAKMLAEEFGGVEIDDGLILRKALPILLGLDPTDTFTQEGKAKVIQCGDREETVRQGLGELGNYLEARYGDYIMPIRAMEMARQEHPYAPFYIYPSVRKNQGYAYKQGGGIVIQINNPEAGPSGNAFDTWDPAFVDIQIDNDPAAGLDGLRRQARFLPAQLQVRLLEALL